VWPCQFSAIATSIGCSSMHQGVTIKREIQVYYNSPHVISITTKTMHHKDNGDHKGAR